MEPMQIFDFDGFYGIESQCGVSTFYHNGKTIIIFTELHGNPGTSVTNGFELIANQYLNITGFDVNNVIFIEHHSNFAKRPETFDLVELKWNEVRAFHEPSWKHLKREEVLQLIGLINFPKKDPNPL